MIFTNKTLITLLLLLFLLTACTEISKEAAEAKAIEFVKERVKFYTKDNDSSLDFPIYDLSSVESYMENNKWIVIVQVSTQKNISRKTEVTVELDVRDGKVISFNNQPVNYQ